MCSACLLSSSIKGWVVNECVVTTLIPKALSIFCSKASLTVFVSSWLTDILLLKINEIEKGYTYVVLQILIASVFRSREKGSWQQPSALPLRTVDLIYPLRCKGRYRFQQVFSGIVLRLRIREHIFESSLQWLTHLSFPNVFRSKAEHGEDMNQDLDKDFPNGRWNQVFEMDFQPAQKRI